MDTITRIISLPNAVGTILSKQSLYEQGIHDNIESVHVSGGWDAEYTVIVGSGGILPFPTHSHIPVLADKKNIILSHIGHDYEPYYRFSFILEDTMFHSHSATHVYYCMDDDDGGVALYCMDLSECKFGEELGSPETCYRATGFMAHSHTITLVRHAMGHALVPTTGSDGSATTSTASGADPTTP
jgi:hypothetical protein